MGAGEPFPNEGQNRLTLPDAAALELFCFSAAKTTRAMFFRSHIYLWDLLANKKIRIHIKASYSKSCLSSAVAASLGEAAGWKLEGGGCRKRGYKGGGGQCILTKVWKSFINPWKLPYEPPRSLGPPSPSSSLSPASEEIGALKFKGLEGRGLPQALLSKPACTEASRPQRQRQEEGGAGRAECSTLPLAKESKSSAQKILEKLVCNFE